MDVRYDRYSLIVNGRRRMIRSGAMHYFRLPSQALWADRLYKLRAAGYNTVDLYLNWGFHSQAPGQYDFTGIRDIGHLLALTRELGLMVIARPGPYINAEVSAGGFPYWLLTQPDVLLRNRLPDGTFQWSEPYMDAVRQWYDAVLPFLATTDNLLMVQVENEYATADVEPDYLRTLYNWVRDQGIQVPIFHNDLYAAGLYEEVVDLYAFDHYPVTSFDVDWHEQAEGSFAVADTVEERLRPICDNRPLFVAELQAGWFVPWCGPKYAEIDRQLGREHLPLLTKSLIGQGLTAFNHYMAIGGTNWGTLGSTDSISSYDFAAPINEAGINTERLYEAKALNLLLHSFDLTATERVVQPPFTLDGEAASRILYAIRRHVSRLNEYWMVLRNLDAEPCSVVLDRKWTVHLKPFEAALLPYHIDLACGYRLLRATVEPLFQNESLLVLRGDRPVSAQLEIDLERFPAIDVDIVNGQASVSRHLDSTFTVTCPTLAPDAFEVIRIGSVTLFLLGSRRVDTLWLQEDGFLMVGPEARLHDQAANNVYGLRLSETAPSREMLVIAPHGTLTRERGFEPVIPPKLPILKNWRVIHAAPELHLRDAFHPVGTFADVTSERPAVDLDTLGVHEGSGWYHLTLPGQATELTLEARHLWAVFLNGELLAHGDNWPSGPGDAGSGPVTLPIPAHRLHLEKPNDLVLYVDSLGHPKGFHEDVREPQGLVQLAVDGRDVRPQLGFSKGCSTWKAPLKQMLGMMPDQSPAFWMETLVHLEAVATVDEPIALRVRDLPAERANIYLNGTLVGRTWRRCGAQTLFYLPDGLLKRGEDVQNTLSLLLWNVEPLLTQADCQLTPEQVSLVPYDTLTRVRL